LPAPIPIATIDNIKAGPGIANELREGRFGWLFRFRVEGVVSPREGRCKADSVVTADFGIDAEHQV
jgi:hypothetical protein